MSTTEVSPETLITRPKRADARRNYEKVLAAAREAFAEGGESTALEEIARRAGVGIGTLYRHFPNRQALLEALYVNEVEEVCRSAAELDGGDPWEALNAWFERLMGYLATKQALVHELLNYLETGRPAVPGVPDVAVRRRRSAAQARPGSRGRPRRRRVPGGHADGRWGSPRSRPATRARSSTSCGSRSTAFATAPEG